MPASNPLIANAAAITRLARTPSRRVIVKSSAAARSANPMIVRRRKSQCDKGQQPMMIPIRSTIFIRRPPIVKLSTKKLGKRAPAAEARS